MVNQIAYTPLNPRRAKNLSNTQLSLIPLLFLTSSVYSLLLPLRHYLYRFRPINRFVSSSICYNKHDILILWICDLFITVSVWCDLLSYCVIGFMCMTLSSSNRLAVPVISVGNLTWGGNGKTPMVEFITRCFLDSGISPLILTRVGFP